MDLSKLDLMVQKQNGRVVNVTQTPVSRMKVFAETNESFESLGNRMVYGIQQPTAVSDAYFSKPNIKRIQNLIRYSVWKKSQNQYVIDPQDETELLVLMRSTYFQYQSLNPEIPVLQQVTDLNNYVIAYAVPNVISKIQQYIGYLQSLQALPVPIDRAVSLSSKGSRLLPSVTTTF